ncbi:MAG: aminotransferase class V-fold PLP-dependent enzyme [Verrucomicrobiae bacterium]|nr:aminotransferase class V-fold PLP-dependent enzyme [Verrucomicrobiae bacterium]
MEAMLPFLRDSFGNPSSGYAIGREAKKAVSIAREQVASLIGAQPDEIIFTSCGTEADNTAIESAIRAYPERRHLVIAATEHDAVINYCLHLEVSRGYEVTVLGVDSGGRINLDELESAIRPNETALVSLMWGNNETGVLHPIAEASAIAEAKGALFHTDAVQATGKVPMNLSQLPVHYLAISGHKLHAPKGVGVLYVKKNVRFQPLLIGGGQESHRRAGTENVPYLVALGVAAGCARQHLESHASPSDDPVRQLRDRFESEIVSRVEGVHINGNPVHRAPNTSNIRIDGVDASGAIILLDQRGICCSAGSACTTGALKPSHVLTAMGIPGQQARESLRISFSRFNTGSELDAALEAIEATVVKLRSLRPGGIVA